MDIGTRDEVGGAAYFASQSVRKGIWRAKRKPGAFARERVKMNGDHRIFLARKPSIPSMITVEGSLFYRKGWLGPVRRPRAKLKVAKARL